MTLKILLAAAVAVALGAGGMAALLSHPPQADDALVAKTDALAVQRDGAKAIRVIPITKGDRVLVPPPEPPPAKQPDRLPQQALLLPEAPTPVPPQAHAPRAMPELAMPELAAEPEPERAVNHVSRETGRRRHAGDICARTGGWRVTLRGGRSWRCAYR